MKNQMLPLFRLIIVESRYGIHIEIPFSFPPCDIRIINLQKIIKFLE